MLRLQFIHSSHHREPISLDFSHQSGTGLPPASYPNCVIARVRALYVTLPSGVECSVGKRALSTSGWHV